MDESFGKRFRVRKRVDYLRIQKGRPKKVTPHFLVFTEKGEGRLGLTVSRKVGCAVVRNGLKRRLREYARKHKVTCSSVDVVLIAKHRAARLGNDELQRELQQIWRIF